MKILDIITPHETLTEANPVTDWMARSGKKIRDIANDVGEKADVPWLRTLGSNKIDNYVEKLLKDAGKDLKRSKGLAAAEKELLDIEKNISLLSGSKKNFDDMAEYLADKLIKEQGQVAHLPDSIPIANGSPSLIPNVPTYKVRELAKADKNIDPKLKWIKNLEQKKDFDAEFNEWLRKSVNARIKIKQEIDNAPLAPTPPKTKEEKAREKLANDKLANDQLEQDTRKTELTKKDKEIKNPYPKGLLRKTMRFANDVGMSLTRWDALFASAEFSRLVVQYWAQHKAIEVWANAQSDMPGDLAKLFPPVINGKPQVGGEAGGESYTYSTEEDRYGLAAAYAYDKIWARLILQIKALGVSLFLSQGLLYVGGGTAGKASTIRRILNIVTIFKIRLHLGDILAPILRGSSKLGQMMFVDYFISVTNPNTNQENSYTAGIISALNKVPEYVNSSSRIPPVPNFGYDPNIYNAWKDFSILDILYSDKPIKEFIDSGLFQHTSSALGRGVIPIDKIADVIAAGAKEVLNWIIAVIPYLNDAVPADDLDIPVGNPKPITEPKVVAEPGGSKAVQDQGDLANVPTAGAPASAPVQSNQAPVGVRTPTTNPELDPFIIRESLKRRVERLMRS